MAEKYLLPTMAPDLAPSDEYYRILFAGIEKKCTRGYPRTIAVTSTMKGEGKTTTVTQLSKIAARDFGKKVLLLEGDSKSPQIHLVLGNLPSDGKAIGSTQIKGLDVMTLDNVIKNKKINGPAFSAGLKKIIEAVSQGYDYILIDCPPILPLVDMQIIAEMVDGILMVIRADGPSRSFVNSALASIPKEKLLGVVLNGVTTGLPGYGYGYNYV